MLSIKVVAGKNLLACDINGKSDPYVVISCGTHSVQTKYKSATLAPEWNEDFTLALPEPKLVLVQVFDHDVVTKDDPMGSCSIKADEYRDGQVVDKWFPLAGKEASGEIHLVLHYKK